MAKLENINKNVTWLTVALICFCTVWNFNVIQNAYYYLGQSHSISVMLVVFILYFLPYALIVGELGSTFKKAEGGLSGWVKETIGSNSSYFVGWISWVVLLPYLSQRPINMIVSVNWIMYQGPDVSTVNPVLFQVVATLIFLTIWAFAFRGFKVVHILSNIGGMSMIVFAMIFIALTFVAPAFNVDPTNVKSYSIDITPSSFLPADIGVIASLSILIFACAGVEQVGPYIIRMKNAAKDFPKGIISIVLFIIVINILGVLAMCVMFGANGEEMGTDFITNGQFIAFQKLGMFFGIGNTLMYIFAALRFVSEVALTMIIIDAPIRMLVESSDERFFPRATLKQNKYGTYPAWLIIEGILVTLICILPIFGIDNVDALIRWMLEVNSICSPIINLCAFLAYMLMKAGFKKVVQPGGSFIFVKNKKLGFLVGLWCFLITSSSIVLQIIDSDIFVALTKALIPVVLLGLGLMVPILAKFINK